MAGVGFVVHAPPRRRAAQDDHQRNSIDATRHVFEAAADAGVRRASTSAAWRSSSRGTRSAASSTRRRRSTPAHPARALRLGQGGVGAARREAGGRAQPGHQDRPAGSARRLRRLPSARAARPRAGAVLRRHRRQEDAAQRLRRRHGGRVIRSYVEDFAAAPPLVNLVEAPPPTRRRARRPLHGAPPGPQVLLVPGLAAARARRPAQAGAANRARQQAARRRLRGVRQRALSHRCRRAGDRRGRRVVDSPPGRGDDDAPRRPRAVLMCHAESRLNREGMARWLASFTDLVGMVVIDERGQHTKDRASARKSSASAGCGSSTCWRSAPTTAWCWTGATRPG